MVVPGSMRFPRRRSAEAAHSSPSPRPAAALGAPAERSYPGSPRIRRGRTGGAMDPFASGPSAASSVAAPPVAAAPPRRRRRWGRRLLVVFLVLLLLVALSPLALSLTFVR